MMEIAVLLKLLTPAVPFLVGLANMVGEGTAQAVGTDIWNNVKAKLGGKLTGHALAQPAIAQLKQEPDNANLQAMVQLALKDLLEKDPALAAELGELLQGAKPTPAIHVEIESTGDYNTNVGVNYGQM